MKKQWMFMVLMLALVVAACAAMPVMAEQMIASSTDKVMTEDKPQADPETAPKKRRATTVSGNDADFVSYPLTASAMSAMEQAAREAYEKVFGEQVPQDYKALDALASEEGGDIRCVLMLMPADWEASTGTLSQEDDRSYYSFTFGGVNVDTGAASLLGLQRFRLAYDPQEAIDVAYTKQQMADMEQAARVFAEEQGMNPGALIATDKVAGSFAPGCMLVFDLKNEKDVSVTVSAEGDVSGYSLVRAKG